ncbi:hypothetical protein [Mycobacterium leprae]|uniref:hypothetical protein n=1 Tax=Mycobacterium leprae TaxID=1769 RepID=UPI0018D4CD24|nr:hypothetical protein [Mycobacterium leprae]
MLTELDPMHLSQSPLGGPKPSTRPLCGEPMPPAIVMPSTHCVPRCALGGLMLGEQQAVVGVELIARQPCALLLASGAAASL